MDHDATTADATAEGRLVPALGVSWEGRPMDLLEAVAGHVDVVEVVPDCLVGPDGQVAAARLRELDLLAADLDMTYHGIGLSIGSADGWNEEYLGHLETLLAWRRPLWHSEHLGLTRVDGPFLGTMGCLPQTVEALDLVVERALALQDRYGLELMLEHVATPLDRSADMSLATFVNTVAAETGSRMLLDLHDLECDADNGLLDLEVFFDELDWNAVGEIHVAGGVWREGRHLDVHAVPVAESTLDLLRTALANADRLGLVVYEVLASALPALGQQAVVDQLAGLRDILDDALLDRARPQGCGSRGSRR